MSTARNLTLETADKMFRGLRKIRSAASGA